MSFRQSPRALSVLATSGIILGVVSCGSPETNLEGTDLGDPYPNQPGTAAIQGENNFANLINNYAKGQPAKQPWVGYWFPYTDNGIASGKYGGGKSPAGKYDAARGKKTSAEAWEVQHHGTGVKNAGGWWGHCNGWSAAAQLYPEPRESKKVNGIVFEIADIKALLSEGSMLADTDFYGTRVDFAQDYYTPKYNDVIPDQYLLVLMNYMGKLKMGVNLDRYTGDQVWNQPMAGYKIEYPKKEDYIGPSPDAPNVYRINVTSTIWWGEDGVTPGEVSEPFEFQLEGTSRHWSARTLRSEVWLDGPVEFDASGKMVKSGNLVVARQGEYLAGGKWLGEEGLPVDAHPDYLWVPYANFNPVDSQLNDPADEYANNQVDIQWVVDHVSKGVDDTSVVATPVGPAPSPTPHPSPSITAPSGPQPQPNPRPSHHPLEL